MKAAIIILILMCSYQAIGNVIIQKAVRQCQPNEIFRVQCNFCQCDAFGTFASCTTLDCCQPGTTTEPSECVLCFCTDAYQMRCSTIDRCTTTQRTTTWTNYPTNPMPIYPTT